MFFGLTLPATNSSPLKIVGWKTFAFPFRKTRPVLRGKLSNFRRCNTSEGWWFTFLGISFPTTNPQRVNFMVGKPLHCRFFAIRLSCGNHKHLFIFSSILKKPGGFKLFRIMRAMASLDDDWKIGRSRAFPSDGARRSFSKGKGHLR